MRIRRAAPRAVTRTSAAAFPVAAALLVTAALVSCSGDEDWGPQMDACTLLDDADVGAVTDAPLVPSPIQDTSSADQSLCVWLVPPPEPDTSTSSGGTDAPSDTATSPTTGDTPTSTGDTPTTASENTSAVSSAETTSVPDGAEGPGAGDPSITILVSYDDLEGRRDRAASERGLTVEDTSVPGADEAFIAPGQGVLGMQVGPRYIEVRVTGTTVDDAVLEQLGAAAAGRVDT